MIGVAGGEHHSMFWREDGVLYSTGSNASGQLAIRFFFFVSLRFVCFVLLCCAFFSLFFFFFFFFFFLVCWKDHIIFNLPLSPIEAGSTPTKLLSTLSYLI